VAAAVAGVNIHFSRRNDHFLSLLNLDMNAEDDRKAIPIQDWDWELYLQDMLREGVDKLQGLGAASSAVSVSEIDIYDFNSVQLSLLDADYLRFLSRSKHILKLFQMKFDNFLVGRDGQCCISIRSSVVDDLSSTYTSSRAADSDSVCMLRPFRFIVLVAADTKSRDLASHHNDNCTSSLHCIADAPSTMYLKLSMRGNFYSDVTFSTNLSFTLESHSLQWLSQSPSHELNYSELGLLSNVFFVYTIPKQFGIAVQ
jgi:hypothetical protein